jgi:S-DNA-T family DNA segregation ATPase FtsK/SpoIIIE
VTGTVRRDRDRTAAYRRDGKRCHRCGTTRGPFQVDHVQRLADNGPLDWTAVLCEPCHHRQSRKAAARTPRPPVRQPTVGVTLIVAAALWMAGRPALAVVAAARIVAAAAATARPRALRAARRARVAALTDALARATHTYPDMLIFRPTRWDQDTPVTGWCRYSPVFDDEPGSADRTAVEQLLGRKIGVRVAVTWEPHRDCLRWAPDATPPNLPVASGAVPEDRIVARLSDAVQAFVRGTAAVRADGPDRLTIDYPATLRDDDDAVRAALAGIVAAKAPTGRWRAHWDTADNRVTFTRRPPMPDAVDHPPRPAALGWQVLPFGVGEHGEHIAVDLTVTPHVLVAGETGSGKTVALNGLIAEALGAGFDVRLVDPKRVEFVGWRGHLGVSVVASELDAMLAAVEDTWQDMEDRYQALEADPGAPLRPILLVLDEAHEWIERANQGWRNGGKQAAKGTGNEHPVVDKWRSIARLGRTARVHLVVGVQRPDAAFFGGAARANFGSRIACGRMKAPEDARMMFGDASYGRDVPQSAKGRATAQIGDAEPVEVQVFWTPAPQRVTQAAPHRSTEHVEALDDDC